MQSSRDKVVFWCLLAVQAAGSQMILWGGLPIYLRIQEPGAQGASTKELAVGVAAVIVMQAAHWPATRLGRTLHFRRNVILSHILNWVGELSIFFTAALTTLLVFNRIGHSPIVLWKVLDLLAVTFAVASYKYQIMSVGNALIEGEIRPEVAT